MTGLTNKAIPHRKQFNGIPNFRSIPGDQREFWRRLSPIGITKLIRKWSILRVARRSFRNDSFAFKLRAAAATRPDASLGLQGNIPQEVGNTLRSSLTGTKVAFAFRRHSERNPKPSVRSMLWRWVTVRFSRCCGFWEFHCLS